MYQDYAYEIFVDFSTSLSAMFSISINFIQADISFHSIHINKLKIFLNLLTHIADDDNDILSTKIALHRRPFVKVDGFMIQTKTHFFEIFLIYSF